MPDTPKRMTWAEFTRHIERTFGPVTSDPSFMPCEGGGLSCKFSWLDLEMVVSAHENETCRWAVRIDTHSVAPSHNGPTLGILMRRMLQNKIAANNNQIATLQRLNESFEAAVSALESRQQFLHDNDVQARIEYDRNH